MNCGPILAHLSHTTQLGTCDPSTPNQGPPVPGDLKLLILILFSHFVYGDSLDLRAQTASQASRRYLARKYVTL